MAQDFPFGAATREELGMKKYERDPSAHAVVLSEYGRSILAIPTVDEIRLQEENINTANTDEIKLIFEYHVKIKVLDNKGIDKGTVVIEEHNKGKYGDIINDISATTTYIDNDGKVKKVDINIKNVSREIINKELAVVKFTLPDVREGSVIEYKYRSLSPFWDSFHTWNFQDNIPKVYSEYDTQIPGFWKYNMYLSGSLYLTKKTNDVALNCFASHGATSDCSHSSYVMTNIPAFPDDSYIVSPKNFKSAIYFKLAEFTNPATMVVKKYVKDWAEIDEDFKNASYFGKQLKRANQVKEFITPIIANSATPLDKAKAIYAFVKSSIKWDGINASGSDQGVVKAFQSHTGNSGDINLALVAALNAAGLNADAMLLATRDKGVINKAYATESDFNYVVAKVTIDDKTYFMDATEPSLPFGMLPLRCLNGEGRVISMNKPAEWVDINPQVVQKTAFSRNLLFNQKIQNLF
jgi:hypothetical protein